jgi:hypothetical protein
MPTTFEPKYLEAMKLEKALRDCWEGCIPWHEAIEMVGAPEYCRADLRRFWNGLNRKLEASQRAY